MGKYLEFAIGALNGVVGDYLEARGNGLAIPMSFVHRLEPLLLSRAAFDAALPAAGPRVVVLLHGLMCTESIFDMADGMDYGRLLERDLGYTPLYVRYNTGRSIADNGAELARLLEGLLTVYPVAIEELLLLGYSMGGLVIRSACHVASEQGLSFLSRVRKAVYVGTPHRGAPLERAGRVLTKVLAAIPDPYTRLIADIGNLRSDGVKDLGDAELRHEDRARRKSSFALTDPEHPVPLLPSIEHFLVAATLSTEPLLASLFGDSLVPVPSGTNGAVAGGEPIGIPPDHVRILPGFDHIRLAHDPAVYECIHGFLGGHA